MHSSVALHTAEVLNLLLPMLLYRHQVPHLIPSTMLGVYQALIEEILAFDCIQCVDLLAFC